MQRRAFLLVLMATFVAPAFAQGKPKIVLLFADNFPQLQRQRRRNWDSARHRFVIVNDLGRFKRRQNSSDDIGRIITAHAADDRIQVGRLTAKCCLSKMREIEPHRDG